jgi:hypothetical protein
MCSLLALSPLDDMKDVTSPLSTPSSLSCGVSG